MAPSIKASAAASPSVGLGNSERTPLLSDGAEPTSIDPIEQRPKDGAPRRKGGKATLFLVCLLAIIVDFGGYLAVAPQTKLFEDIICNKFYSSRNGSDGDDGPFNSWANDRCKEVPVQSELALVMGWKETFDQIPGIALALPFGVVADRWGRKPVLLIALFGGLLSETWLRVVCWWPAIFPLRLVWMAPLFQMIGGGSQVSSSVLLVIIADIAPEAERTTFLSIVFAAVLISAICGIPAGAALTQIDPWLPFSLAWLLYVLGFLFVFAFPETLRSKGGVRDSRNEEDQDSTVSGGEATTALKARIFDEAKKIYDSTHFIWRNWSVLLLLPGFFVGDLGRQSMLFLIIYASRKYGWSIADASYLYTVRSVTSLVVLLLVLPLLTKLLTKRFGMRVATNDLVLSQGQAVLIVLGMLTIAFADAPWLLISGITVVALGSGFGLTLLSLVTSLVAAHHFATLYAVLQIVGAAGKLVAGPALAATLQWGLVLGPPWLGMPFLFAAALFVPILVCLSLVGLVEPPAADAVEAAEEQPVEVE